MAGIDNRNGRRAARPFPPTTLEEALQIPNAIQESSNGKPLRRILLAEAVGLSQASSVYRELLRASRQYGLTVGTEKAPEVQLTELGRQITKPTSEAVLVRARQDAVLNVPKVKEVFERFNDGSLPDGSFFQNQLSVEFAVPDEWTTDFSDALVANGRFAGIIRDGKTGPVVVLDPNGALLQGPPAALTSNSDARSDDENAEEQHDETPHVTKTPEVDASQPGALFLGHGKSRKPLEDLKELLRQYRVPCRVATEEANLARPISVKVRETMQQCTAAILIFTADQQYFDDQGNEIWRPSENVVHELGAASFAYEDRVVIFKESGIDLPSNFSDIGYIEFEKDNLSAKGGDLFKELLGLGILQVSVAGSG